MTSLMVMVRHATTDWNEQHRLQGRADRPLSETGRREATAWKIPILSGLDADAPSFVSPLHRCVQTAALMGLTPKKEPALIETDWGEWEGQRLVDIRAADPEGLAEREAAGLDFFPPGGESARDVQERLMPFLAERAHDEKGTIAIAHRGTLRALYALCVGWDMTGPPPDKMRPACAHAFSLEIDGAVHIHTLNLPLDTS